MRALALSFCLLFTLVCAPLQAQSESKPAEASVVFDLRMDKITGSPLGKMLDLEKKMAEAPSGGGPDMAKVVRVFGAMTAPENMASVEGMQGGDLPIDFFVRIKFKDADGAKSMLQQAIDDNGGTIERDGRTYYKSPEQSGVPAGIMMYSVDDTTVEIGTEAFAFRTNNKPFTAGLNLAWDSAPDEAVRLAIDLQSSKALIEEVVETGKAQAQGNPIAAGYFELLPKMKNLILSIDLEGNNLLTLQSTGNSASDATDLKDGIESILGFAKMGGKAQAEGLKQVDPEGSAVLVKLIDGLNASLDGEKITVALPRPEGFDKAVAGALEKFGGSIFGGGMAPGF